MSGYALGGDSPLLNAVQTTLKSPSGNAYVARLNSSGVLQFATYLGGSGGDLGIGMAVDSLNNGYVSGWTESTDFPTTAGAFQTALNGTQNAFAAKFSPEGALLYSTLLGGAATYGEAIAVDSLGSAYVTGNTNASAFPGAPAGGAQPTNGGGVDAFVAKLNPGGTALTYFTFLGGAGTDGGSAIAVDSSFNAYITGGTSSSGLATAGAAYTTLMGGTNAFAAKLNSNGSAFTYITYLGGNRVDSGGLYGSNGLALDASVPPNVYLSGSTDSTNFPTPMGIQSTFPGNGTSVFGSTNSGSSFSPVDSTIPGAVSDVSINPTVTSAVALTESGIYRTANGGPLDSTGLTKFCRRSRYPQPRSARNSVRHWYQPRHLPIHGLPIHGRRRYLERQGSSTQLSPGCDGRSCDRQHPLLIRSLFPLCFQVHRRRVNLEFRGHGAADRVHLLDDLYSGRLDLCRGFPS